MDVFILIYGLISTVVVCYLLLRFLPLRNRILGKDRGKKFVVGSEINIGKPTGVGIYFISAYILLAFSYIWTTDLFHSFGLFLSLLVMAGAMITGYLDDISKNPWNEYKKGALDAVVALAGALVIVVFFGSDFAFGITGLYCHLNPIIYVLLAFVLIIVSINSTNATDGVDGLSGSLSVISILTIIIVSAINGNASTKGVLLGVLLIAALCCYLRFNLYPSKMLMGDAGSRSIGFFIAFYAMYMKIPFAYLIICLPFMLDGGLSVLKITIGRLSLKLFKKKIIICKNILTPVHDHLKQVKGFSNKKTWTIITTSAAVIDVVYIISCIICNIIF